MRGSPTSQSIFAVVLFFESGARPAMESSTTFQAPQLGGVLLVALNLSPEPAILESFAVAPFAGEVVPRAGAQRRRPWAAPDCSGSARVLARTRATCALRCSPEASTLTEGSWRRG